MWIFVEFGELLDLQLMLVFGGLKTVYFCQQLLNENVCMKKL